MLELTIEWSGLLNLWGNFRSQVSAVATFEFPNSQAGSQPEAAAELEKLFQKPLILKIVRHDLSEIVLIGSWFAALRKRLD
jgi:hypothetical protein